MQQPRSCPHQSETPCFKFPYQPSVVILGEWGELSKRAFNLGWTPLNLTIAFFNSNALLIWEGGEAKKMYTFSGGNLHNKRTFFVLPISIPIIFMGVSNYGNFELFLSGAARTACAHLKITRSHSSKAPGPWGWAVDSALLVWPGPTGTCRLVAQQWWALRLHLNQ